jgi:mannose-1-phosphate guanylyltransferase/mannose-6-phosphate isomerase
MKKNNSPVFPVLISGGVGKRLWPFSRIHHPKQLLKFYNSHTLLQNTVLRCEKISLLDQPLMICNKQRRFSISSQLDEIHANLTAFIMEPNSCNTGPATVIAALYALENLNDPLLLITPVDHKIDDVQGLARSLEIAIEYAENNKIVIFGVKPASANSNYGYIEIFPDLNNQSIFRVKSFIEKPSPAIAKKIFHSGVHYWNAGLYLFKASRIISDFEKFQPKLLEICKDALKLSKRNSKFITLPEDAYSQCAAISLDYAIAEKTDNIYMVSLQSPWTDIGSWELLYQIGHKDSNGNVLHGNTLVTDTQDSYIHAEQRLVTTIGMDNCFIIDTRDALLVANRNSLHEIPNVVNALEKAQRSEAIVPTIVHRPWGYYVTIETSANYQIKKIVICSNQKISLQEHQYRSEHWVVVKGEAIVTLGHDQRILKPNESIFVPIGVRHRIENKQEHNLELIEVQIGSYLGEDDIKRYDDIYHRDSKDE